MSKLIRSPKVLAAVLAVGVLFIVGLAGGALGNEFQGGFLGAPLQHIQLPAESLTADEILPGFKVTNTMVATWLTIGVLAALAFLATRRLREVPRGLQNLFEVVIEFFLNLAESVAGPARARRFLPLVLTIFIFIMTANWLGILPGFGTIGKVETATEAVCHEVGKVHTAGGGKGCPTLSDPAVTADVRKATTLQVFDEVGPFAVLPFGSVGDEVTADKVGDDNMYAKDPGGKPKLVGRLTPFIRSANTDLNTTLAIALVAMFMVHLWGVRTLGFRGHSGKFINIKGGAIGLFVGVLEGISEVARIISFTFRLFGNIFAGEVLLVAMAFLVPLIGIIPFLGLELFVGVIQAFIFAMLTLVFAAAATISHAAEEH